MKKKRTNENLRRVCTALLCLCTGWSVFAQDARNIGGVIVDEHNETVVGATVLVKGSMTGTISKFDGTFTLEVPENATLVVSYVGYITQEIPVSGVSDLRIVLKENAQVLDDLVVIGYGSVKKDDLTGSVTAIGEKDFRKGTTATPAELISGKVAGVQIISNGGQAGAGSRIRIRGGASLNAGNDPLIVIDGVPVDNGDILGASNSLNVSNPLSTINPNDIESMNILKDASATAIYGSRASNGVILITTKKGVKGQTLRVAASSQNSVAIVAQRIDVMSADEFREAVRSNPFTDQRYIDMLGTANTDWQKEIFRAAFTTDNNLNVSGSVKNLPFRVSAGVISQDGILKTDNMKRTTASINISPSLWDNHLNISLNLKGSFSHIQFGNKDAIGAALRMDPTKPVTADGFDNFNGFWTWMDGNTGNPNALASKNPVALLRGKNDKADILRSIGNVQFDYKMHFLPELRANLNLGYDVSEGDGKIAVQPWSSDKYIQGGERSKYQQNKQNLLLEFYLNYLAAIATDHRLEVMAGYTYQDRQTTKHEYAITDFSGSNEVIAAPAFPKFTMQNTLVSFYGRINYNMKERYLLTATLRRDGSSRFGADNRWGLFPSIALAWRISEENFAKSFENLSSLKLRVGYGVTGQQDGIGDYDHIARYDYSDPTAQVQFGNNFYQLWRPAGYAPDRKWEQTATTNAGLDWGFAGNRISGSVDYYYKHTTDLLNEVPLPMGSNFTNKIVKNIGSLDNQGIEINLNVVALDTEKLGLNIGFNLTHNRTKITKLSMNDGPDTDYVGAPVGGITGGTGNTVQIHSVGHAPSMFYLYKQLYAPDGMPIEGAYADLSDDGVINEKDLYRYKSPEPDVFMGFNFNFRYMQWTLSSSLRASIGNYMYNNVFSDAGNYSQVLNPNNNLLNTVTDIRNTGFFNRELLSDYYVSNASFLKMDYVSLSYDFDKLIKKVNIRATFTVQNVFVVTKYEGIDPEIAGGIDNNFYPNPRTFGIGINIGF
ncbi:MAG: TonB-dependent receptor [Bacteroidales bacterium]|jgi:iron complex outermembrane receptor protein|nr:TonB-dependent receptor [Bacteroidales bacterium]